MGKLFVLRKLFIAMNTFFYVLLALTCAAGNADSTSYMSSQLFSRNAYGFGMYVVQGWGNIDNKPIVVGYYLQNLQPSVEWEPDGAYLWHWTELDWEFVPQTISPQREQVECTGIFPSASCTNYRSRSYTDNTKIAGTYTDDVLASQTAKPGSPQGSGYTWSQLVNATGTGLTWTDSSTWGLPASLALPSRANLENSVAINYFRMPTGTKQVTKSSYTEQFIPGGGSVAAGGTSGGNLTSETFVWATVSSDNATYTYNPTTLHTYTIIWTPELTAFYIDAPDEGRQIDGLTPIKVFTASDYPSTVPQGVNYPAGEYNVPFFGKNKKLDDLLFMFNVYPFAGWGGTPDYTTARTYIRSAAFYPIKEASISKTTLTRSDFTTDTSNPGVLYANMANWTSSNWRYNLTKDFVVELAGVWDDVAGSYPTVYPDSVSWVQNAPDGSGPALEMVAQNSNQAPAQSYYYLMLNRNALKSQTTWNMKAEIVSVNGMANVAYAKSSTYSNEIMTPFWAPNSSVVSIKAVQLDTVTGKPTGVSNTCPITLTQTLCANCTDATQMNLTYSIGTCDNTAPNFQFLNPSYAGATVNHGNSGRVDILPMTATGAQHSINVGTASSLSQKSGSASSRKVTIKATDNAVITLQLKANDIANTMANWYVVASTPFGVYRYSAGAGWLPGFNYEPSYVGPLFNVDNFVLYNGPLPAGEYHIYFALQVGDNPVKVFDVEDLVLTHTAVTVQ